MTGSAKQSIATKEEWIGSSQELHAMTVKKASRSGGAVSPRFASSFALPRKEGAGKTGCALHPRSRVQVHKRVRTRAYRSSGEHPAFPAQWLYGLCRDLPGEPSSVATVACRIAPTSLAPASGARTTRFCRTLEPRASGVTPASTASHPTSVTIASAPLSEQDGQGDRVICISEKRKYFCKGGLTGFADLPVRLICRRCWN